MAGAATISLGAFMLISFLILAICILYMQWVMSGGPQQLSYIISSAIDDVGWWWRTSAIPALESAGETIADAWSQAMSSVERKYRAGMKRLAISLSLAIASTTIKDEEVYLISMLVPGLYREYIFRMPIGSFIYDPSGTGREADSRYKYGTTKIYIGVKRYSGHYIGAEINRGNFLYTSILSPLTFWEARMTEKRYIYAYYMRYHIYPPGNSKLG